MKWDFGKVADLIPAILEKAAKPSEVEAYHLWHDCGKPFCRTVDDEGKQHFPDHARVSAETWRNAGGDESTAWFIERDMDFHGKDPDITDPRAPTLLLTAWAEIHANSQMFGGTDSTSFKIKRKHLEKLTRRVYEHHCLA